MRCAAPDILRLRGRGEPIRSPPRSALQQNTRFLCANVQEPSLGGDINFHGILYYVFAWFFLQASAVNTSVEKWCSSQQELK